MKPEIIKEYDSNGNIRKIVYYFNNKIHREDGPAVTWFYVNGNISTKGYYLNNKYHREDGPAIIRYDENGNIDQHLYYLNNIRLTESEFLIYQRKRKLKTL